jgi:hypothetical protein
MGCCGSRCGKLAVGAGRARETDPESALAIPLPCYGLAPPPPVHPTTQAIAKDYGSHENVVSATFVPDKFVFVVETTGAMPPEQVRGESAGGEVSMNVGRRRRAPSRTRPRTRAC